jgi:trigger factor
MITKIGHVERAEMNDEFFKVAYPSKNIQSEEEFRKTVKEEIQSYWDGQGKNQLQHEIYHILLDHTKIEFPETFLKRWMQSSNEQKYTDEQVEHDYPSFSNQLKWTLITDKIVQDQKFNVDPEDLKKFAKNQLFGYMQMNVTDEEQPWITEYVNRMMQDQKFVEDAYHRILTEKVFDWAETVVQKEETPINAEDFTKMIQEHEHHHHH